MAKTMLRDIVVARQRKGQKAARQATRVVGRVRWRQVGGGQEHRPGATPRRGLKRKHK